MTNASDVLGDSLVIDFVVVTLSSEGLEVSFFSTTLVSFIFRFLVAGLAMIFLFLLTCTPEADDPLFLVDKVSVLSFMLSFSDIIPLLTSSLAPA